MVADGRSWCRRMRSQMLGGIGVKIKLAVANAQSWRMEKECKVPGAGTLRNKACGADTPTWCKGLRPVMVG